MDKFETTEEPINNPRVNKKEEDFDKSFQDWMTTQDISTFGSVDALYRAYPDGLKVYFEQNVWKVKENKNVKFIKVLKCSNKDKKK